MPSARVATLALGAALAAAVCGGCGGASNHAGRLASPATTAASPTAPAAPGGASGGAGSPSPQSQPSRLGAAGPDDWPAYQRDGGRSGSDPAAPPAGTLTKAWTSPSLDASVYAEPLIDGDRVIVATEGDSVYALAASTGAVIWSAKLGTPMDGSALPCGDIDPSGITGTPVIDPAQGLIWVVAFVQPGRHVLFGLDVASGRVRFRGSADAPGADPLVEQERGALALAGATVYVPYGGLYGDCGDYHGFVVGIPETGSGPTRSWVVPTERQGGLWAPAGPVVDPSGNLYVATGNGHSTSAFDEGNSVIRLSPDLRQLDLFAPLNWADLSSADADLGSVSPTLVPGGRVLQVGKEGVGYLLSASHLGGIGGEMFSGRVCDAAFGATAVSGSRVFVACRGGLVALDVGAGPSFSVAWRHQGAGAGSPVVAGGVVWMVDKGGALWGFDPSDGRVRARQTLGRVTPFPSLAVGGGKLFTASGAGIVSFSGV